MERPSTPPRRTTRASEKAVNLSPPTPAATRKLVCLPMRIIISFTFSNLPLPYRRNRAFDLKIFVPKKRPLPAHPAPNVPFPRPLQALSTLTMFMLSTPLAPPRDQENDPTSPLRNLKSPPLVVMADHQPKRMAAQTTLCDRPAKSSRGSWTTI